MFIEMFYLPLKVMIGLPIILLVVAIANFIWGNNEYSEIKSKDFSIYLIKIIFLFLIANAFYFISANNIKNKTALILNITILVLFFITLLSSKNLSKKAAVINVIINIFLFIKTDLFVIYCFNIYLINIAYELNEFVNAVLKWNHSISVYQADQYLNEEEKTNNEIKIQNMDINFKSSVYSSGIGLLINGLFHHALPGLGFILKPFFRESLGAKPYYYDERMNDLLRRDFSIRKKGKADLDENYKKFKFVVISAVIIQLIVSFIFSFMD